MRVATIIFAMVAGTSLASCTQSSAESTPIALTEKQSKMLSKELDGKVAGKPERCISSLSAGNLIRVSDDMLLFRQSGRLVYQNRLRAPCPGLERDHDIIITETFGSQQCQGDLIRLVDRFSGIPGPVCSLGEFVPYRKVATAR
jgi:hypothetical protein